MRALRRALWARSRRSYSLRVVAALDRSLISIRVRPGRLPGGPSDGDLDQPVLELSSDLIGRGPFRQRERPPELAVEALANVEVVRVLALQPRSALAGHCEHSLGESEVDVAGRDTGELHADQ
jgi:hypothetical protein